MMKYLTVLAVDQTVKSIPLSRTRPDHPLSRSRYPRSTTPMAEWVDEEEIADSVPYEFVSYCESETIIARSPIAAGTPMLVPVENGDV